MVTKSTKIKTDCSWPLFVPFVFFVVNQRPQGKDKKADALFRPLPSAFCLWGFPPGLTREGRHAPGMPLAP